MLALSSFKLLSCHMHLRSGEVIACVIKIGCQPLIFPEPMGSSVIFLDWVLTRPLRLSQTGRRAPSSWFRLPAEPFSVPGYLGSYVQIKGRKTQLKSNLTLKISRQGKPRIERRYLQTPNGDNQCKILNCQLIICRGLSTAALES